MLLEVTKIEVITLVIKTCLKMKGSGDFESWGAFYIWTSFSFPIINTSKNGITFKASNYDLCSSTSNECEQDKVMLVQAKETDAAASEIWN